MELQELLQTVRNHVADNQLEAALKLLDAYLLLNRIKSEELSGDVVQLQRQLSAINQANIGGTLSRAEINILENNLTNGILIFLNKLRDYETNQAVRAELSGRGLLMHNIPVRMPVGLPTRCTIRIGAIAEELMRDMEKEEFAQLKEIKVAKVMEVQLSSNEAGAFRIATVNRPEQEVDFETHTEWRYDVTPLREGRHELSLIVSTVRFVDGKDRYTEKVYDITVMVETRHDHLSQKEELPNNWEGVVVVDTPSKEKRPIIPVVPVNPVIRPDIYPELDEDYEEEIEELPSHEPAAPPNSVLNVPSRRSSGKVLALLATVVVLVGAVWAAVWYFNRPHQELADATFAIDPQLRHFEVIVNGLAVKEWAFTADSSVIVLYRLTVGETYGLVIMGKNGSCTDTVTIGNRQTRPYELNCRMGQGTGTSTAPTGLFGLTVLAPYPFETLLLDDRLVEGAAGQIEVKLSVQAGMHRVQAVFSDNLTTCEPADIEVSSDTYMKLNCFKQDESTSSQASFNVQMRVPASVYKFSNGRARPAMDGSPVGTEPGFDGNFYVFYLSGVPVGYHHFTLTGMREEFTCNEYNNQYVGEDMTLTFDCSDAVYNVTVIVPDLMAEHAGQTLDMIVDGKSQLAQRQGNSSSFVLTDISFGSHRFEIKPPGCWICPAKNDMTVTATQRDLVIKCDCVK